MSSLYRRLKEKEGAQENRRPNLELVVPGEPAALEDAHRALKDRVQEQLIAELDASALGGAELPPEEQQKIRAKILELLGAEETISPLERERVCESLFAEIVGYGPIEPLLADPSVTEIMVNGPLQVYVERGGRLERVTVRFRDDAHLLHVIDKIVTPLGRRIDESSPMVDARLPDGSRVNAIIPPLAVSGPTLTVRKFSSTPLEIEDLIAGGTLTREMAIFLAAAVKSRLNIVVSGGTGSGKTTTLNVLSSFIPAEERIVTIEDAAELQLRQEHVVSLETRPPNLEGKGEVPVRQLVRNALRMRPDRIVVGEVRSGETLDMLQAMNTGHDGSLTTCHSNSPRDALARLETMVLMAGVDLPVRAIREQMASAVDLIVHQARLRDGSRRVTHITEVQGMESDVILLQDVFTFQQTGVSADGKALGEFKATGIRPRALERMEAAGYAVPLEVFGEAGLGEGRRKQPGGLLSQRLARDPEVAERLQRNWW